MRTNAWNAGVHVVNLDRFRDEPAVISDVDWVQTEQIINPSQLTQPISIMLACRGMAGRNSGPSGTSMGSAAPTTLFAS